MALNDKERVLLRDLQADLEKHGAWIEYGSGFCGIGFGGDACPTIHFYHLGGKYLSSLHCKGEQHYQADIDAEGGE